MIERHRQQLRPLLDAIGRPVDLLQTSVLAQRALGRAVLEEIVHLDPARHGRRAAVARYREGAAGIGIFAAGLDRLVPQITAQKAAHEGIAGTQDIEHLDREARALDTLLDVVRDCAVEHGAAHRAALHHDQRVGCQLADPPAGFEGLGRAAGNVDFLLGADNQVTAGDDGLELCAHLATRDEPLFSQTVAGQPPQHGPVVDVEDHPAAVLAGEPHRLLAHGIERGAGEMGAGHQDSVGRGDEILVDVVLGQAAIGTVLTKEDQRERILVANPQHHQGGHALRIGLDVADVDALGGGLLLDEAAHMLVAHAGDQAGLEPEPRHADRDVGGTAADILGKARHLLQAATHLLAIEIDRRAADADHI